jgi:hypothetical protein
VRQHGDEREFVVVGRVREEQTRAHFRDYAEIDHPDLT